MRLLLVVLIGAGILVASTANAGPVGVAGPFVGDLTEDWESFANFQENPDFYLSDPAPIFGGAAVISNPYLVIYQPSVDGAGFNLANNGLASVHDGVKAAGVNQETQGFHSANPTADIIFSAPVVAFGGYWGSCVQPSVQCFAQGIVNVSFYDANDNLLDSLGFLYDHTSARDGALDWHGWASSIPIARISYTGDYVVNDGLQAKSVPLPEPSALLLFALGYAAVDVSRRRWQCVARPKRIYGSSSLISAQRTQDPVRRN